MVVRGSSGEEEWWKVATNAGGEGQRRTGVVVETKTQAKSIRCGRVKNRSDLARFEN